MRLWKVTLVTGASRYVTTQTAAKAAAYVEKSEGEGAGKDYADTWCWVSSVEYVANSPVIVK